MQTQISDTNGMECTHLQCSSMFLAKYIGQTRTHFVCSFLGEGDSTYRTRSNVVDADEVHNPRRQDLEAKMSSSWRCCNNNVPTIVLPLPGPASIWRGIEGSCSTAASTNSEIIKRIYWQWTTNLDAEQGSNSPREFVRWWKANNQQKSRYADLLFH